MTRSGENKPSSSASSGARRTQPAKSGPGAADTEAFGRFVSALARLEGGKGQERASRERGR